MRETFRVGRVVILDLAGTEGISCNSIGRLLQRHDPYCAWHAVSTFQQCSFVDTAHRLKDDSYLACGSGELRPESKCPLAVTSRATTRKATTRLLRSLLKQLAAIRERALAANAALLKINADIRQLELLRLSRTRAQTIGDCFLIFGPVLLVLLYAIFWLPWLSQATLIAVCIPGFIVAISCCGAAAKLIRDPGGGPRLKIENVTRRRSESELELEIAKQKDAKK